MSALIQRWLYTPRQSTNPLARLLIRGWAAVDGGLRARREPYRANLPVICVGSPLMGGSGKTPIAREVALLLAELSGSRVALIVRAYRVKRRSPNASIIAKPDSDPSVVGDEAVMLARQLTGSPVMVLSTRSRRDALRLASKRADIAVLDSGFHRTELHRDLDIAVVPPELESLSTLPLGPLREPPSAIARADLRWLHGATDDGRERERYAIGTRYRLAPQLTSLSNPETHAPLEPHLASISLLVTGVARNTTAYQVFCETCGHSVRHLELLDHAQPSSSVLSTIEQFSGPILTTPKDAARWGHRLSSRARARTWVLKPEIEWLWGRDTLIHALSRLMEHA